MSRRDNLLHPDDGGGGGRRGGNNGDEEDDEGTVSDPSPSPQIPINNSAQHFSGPAGTCTTNSLFVMSKSLQLQFYPNQFFSVNFFYAVIGPAKESAVAIIRQCLTIFDPQRHFAEESKALSAQLIAELAKTDVGRSLCLHQVITSGSHAPSVEYIFM